MANRNRTSTAGDSQRRSEISIPGTLPSSTKSKLNDKSDDLIVSLSDAYENRRARQVGEWEQLYDHNVYRAV